MINGFEAFILNKEETQTLINFYNQLVSKMGYSKFEKEYKEAFNLLSSIKSENRRQEYLLYKTEE